MVRQERIMAYNMCMGAFVVLLFMAYVVNEITHDPFSAAMPLAAGAAFFSVGLGGLVQLNRDKRTRHRKTNNKYRRTR